MCFSTIDIKAGEIVEIAPVVIIYGSLSDYPEKHEYKLNGLRTATSDRTILPKEISNIIYGWSNLTNNNKKDQCVALGYGSLYSSANPSNMRYAADEKN